jgi:hypothetical protein
MIMASAEAVMALGTGAYNGLATVDVWTLLVGQSPVFAAPTDSSTFLATVAVGVMAMPAWVVFMLTGFVVLHACRKRARRRVFRSSFS